MTIASHCLAKDEEILPVAAIMFPGSTSLHLQKKLQSSHFYPEVVSEAMANLQLIINSHNRQN